MGIISTRQGEGGVQAIQDSLTIRYEANQLLGKVIRLGSQLQATWRLAKRAHLHAPLISNKLSGSTGG